MHTPGANTPSHVQPASLAPAPPPSDALRVVASSELLQGQVCVNIEHAGALYTLRATRSGKLILTK
ncbi:MAG TPA: hemin uptake protein HemP [Rhodocyclaceae bacterium]|nr:hemin uptake protein HemP [Rhodocyclaceae bacterium]